MNYLSPMLNTAAWTVEEDQLLLEKQREYGSRWAQIAKFFPNRTDGMVKNRFNLLQRRQARVYEVNLRCDAAALLWMIGACAPARTQPRRTAAPPAIEPTPIETIPDFDFESWNDTMDIDPFDL
jgi:hypothetical protein